MSDDFDLISLAAYLHLSPGQISRLAERGKLPGRKVAGQWRFSRSEVHYWIERRIGEGDPAELEAMEEAFARPSLSESVPAFAELLSPEAIAIPLEARTRSSVISSMVEVAARTGWLWDTEAMNEAIRRREELCSTALEGGIALMHPRRPMPQILDRPFVALGRTDTGIAFGGARGEMTDVFFLICSTSDRGHLHTLARLSRMVGLGGFLTELRDAPDARSALDVVLSHAADSANP